MIFTRSSHRIAACAIILFGLGLFLFVNFTETSYLKAVVIDGQPVTDFEKSLGLEQNKSLLNQPLDSLGRAFLRRDNVVKVDIDYHLPNTIEITTNRFAPVCLVLDEMSGRLMGLTEQGRVVPIPPDQEDWELPTITAVKTGKLFAYCDDARVAMVVSQLIKLREENERMFRLVAEVDLGMDDCTIVTISGLNYRLRTKAGRVADQLMGFFSFLEKYTPDLGDTREIDLRFTDMIIQVEKGS